MLALLFSILLTLLMGMGFLIVNVFNFRFTFTFQSWSDLYGRFNFPYLFELVWELLDEDPGFKVIVCLIIAVVVICITL